MNIGYVLRLSFISVSCVVYRSEVMYNMLNHQQINKYYSLWHKNSIVSSSKEDCERVKKLSEIYNYNDMVLNSAIGY